MVHSANGHRPRKGGNSGAPPDLDTTALALHSTEGGTEQIVTRGAAAANGARLFGRWGAERPLLGPPRGRPDATGFSSPRVRGREHRGAVRRGRPRAGTKASRIDRARSLSRLS